MAKSLKLLAEWLRLPVRSGFAELDIQIDKLRILRDSYQTAAQAKLNYSTADIKESGEQLCIQ